LKLVWKHDNVSPSTFHLELSQHRCTSCYHISFYNYLKNKLANIGKECCSYTLNNWPSF